MQLDKLFIHYITLGYLFLPYRFMLTEFFRATRQCALSHFKHSPREPGALVKFFWSCFSLFCSSLFHQ